MADETDAVEATSSPSVVRIELGGLVVVVESATDLDFAARVALGILGKVESLAKRNPVGFVPTGIPSTEIRGVPDLSWRGESWDPDY